MTEPTMVIGLALLIGGGGGEGIAAVAADTSPTPIEAEVEIDRAGVSAGAPEWLVVWESVVEGAWSGGDVGMIQLVVAGLDASFGSRFSAHVGVMSKWGHDGLEFSAQGLSSLDAASFAGPGEVWLQWEGSVAGAGVRLKGGRVDANSEFAATEASSVFANPSFGLSPALALLPSYPTPAWSANVFVGGPAGRGVGGGVYRSGADAWLVVGQLEGAVPWALAEWSAGWAVPVGGGAVEPAAGWVIVERPSSEGLAPFATVSMAGRMALWHVGGGFTAPIGPALARPYMRLGVAASTVAGEVGHEETVVEALLSIRPFADLTIQPHVQLRVAGLSDVVPAGLLRVSIER
jgi:hypothetical protein